MKMSDRIRKSFYEQLLGGDGVSNQEERAAKSRVLDNQRREHLLSILSPLEMFQFEAGKGMIESALCQDSADRAKDLLSKSEHQEAWKSVEDRSGEIADGLQNRAATCIGLGLAIAKAKVAIEAGLSESAPPGMFANEEEQMETLCRVMMHKEMKCGCKGCQKAVALFRFAVDDIESAAKKPWSDEFSEFIQSQEGDADECSNDN